jgi:maltose alpha-D-glucosyltransferase/alpha-amylase
MTSPHWYKNAVFYQVYVRAFYDSNADGHGDLPGLTQKLDYLQALGINCLWLMPIYPSPLKDDGYDIADFCGIHPDYGTLEDFAALLDAAHARGMRVITDLVLNHTSDAHPWFEAARADKDSPYRDYFVWSDSDQKYRDARVIFVDIEASNWAWDPVAGQFYWHRFYASQPDLNYDSPAVRAEVFDVMKFWLDRGVDGFRADAVPYLYEREGTNCENLPETHAFLKEMRRFMDERYPGRLLLCEANQPPHEVRAYFGEGDEFQMAFHFPLMPRIFMSMRTGDAGPIRSALDATPSIPDGCQWAIFLRNHDELTLEMVSPTEREWMWNEYAPEPRMRINLGIRRRLAPLLDHDLRKIELAYSLLFTLPGSPILYYGDEIGMADNVHLSDRNGVRTPMQWSAALNGGFSQAPAQKLYAPVIQDHAYGPRYVSAEAQRADANSLLNLIRRMIAVRNEYPVFGWGDFDWANCENEHVAAYSRRLDGERVLILQNLTAAAQPINIPANQSSAQWADLLSAEGPIKLERKNFALEPYQYLWLRSM